MSTVSMNDKQVGVLHDLALAFGASELDVSPAEFSSLDVAVYTAPHEGERLLIAAFSMSVAGTVRSRPSVAAA